MRARPGDVNLKQRVWVPRDAKGGFCQGVYLNDDQVAAWQLFIDADAWGAYNHPHQRPSVRISDHDGLLAVPDEEERPRLKYR